MKQVGDISQWPGATYASEELAPGQGAVIRIEDFISNKEANHVGWLYYLNLPCGGFILPRREES